MPDGGRIAVVSGRTRLPANRSLRLGSELEQAIRAAQSEGKTAVAAGRDGAARGVLVPPQRGSFGTTSVANNSIVAAACFAPTMKITASIPCSARSASRSTNIAGVPT